MNALFHDPGTPAAFDKRALGAEPACTKAARIMHGSQGPVIQGTRAVKTGTVLFPET